jgi:hypothetical protein
MNEMVCLIAGNGIGLVRMRWFASLMLGMVLQLLHQKNE